jgi:hypothetical protein
MANVELVDFVGMHSWAMWIARTTGISVVHHLSQLFQWIYRYYLSQIYDTVNFFKKKL